MSRGGVRPGRECADRSGEAAGWGVHVALGCARRTIVVGSDAAAKIVCRAGSGRSPAAVDADRVDGQLVEWLHEEAPDEVFFDLAVLDEETVAEAGARLLMDGVDVHFLFPEPGPPPVRAAVARIGPHPVLTLHAVPERTLSRAIRRVVDVLGAAALLIALSPVIAVVAVVVWCTMGRPILHIQQRLGRWGRCFPLYKFRSMTPDAEELLRRSPEIYRIYIASNFKLPAEVDPRITPLGRFLRRTSLDELPQLWNVLRGDMALVGPRPIVPEELGKYGEYGRMLLRVKPGLTGLWQVSGRSRVGYPERARMDLHYLADRSLGGDVRILLRTLPAVIQRRGAV